MPNNRKSEEHKKAVRYKAWRRYYEANKEKLAKRGKDWVKANPGRTREVQRKSFLAQAYGITPERYEELLVSQGGVCAICYQPETVKRKAAKESLLCVDHDHVTGEVRQLLCDACNRGLGYFRENPDRLRSAAAYIEKHKPNPGPKRKAGALDNLALDNRRKGR